VNCRVGDVDSAYGNARNPDGLQGRNRHFRVFAELRDDPFFNNVRGTRAAYQTAATALHNGAVVDAQGSPGLSRATSEAIFDQWRHTDGGPAKNFLDGWTPSALVVSVDLELLTGGELARDRLRDDLLESEFWLSQPPVKQGALTASGSSLGTARAYGRTPFGRRN
jgi:hypothetical protein